MTSNAIDLISAIAEKAGTPNDAEWLKKIQTNPSLASIEVPKEVTAYAQSELLTYDQAKFNPGLKKYFDAMTLDAMDAKLFETAKDYLDEADLQELKKDGVKTIEVVRNMVEKVKAKHAATDNKEDKKAYLAEITKLQNIIAEKEKAIESAVSERDNHWVSTISNQAIQAKAASYNFPPETPKHIAAKVLKETFFEKLKEDGGTWKYDNGNIKLVNADSPELPFSINNKQVAFEEYMDRLAEPMIAKHTVTSTVTVPTPTIICVGGAPTATVREKSSQYWRIVSSPNQMPF